MGTDIHMIAQVRENPTAPWRTVWGNEVCDDRNYSLFAQLAGVRNGSGFAGCDLGDGFDPIAEPRGLPDGLSEHPEGGNGHWLGEHSHSWLLLSELLAYKPESRTAIQRGVVSRAEFEAWDCFSAPKSYCGDISGRNVCKTTQKALRAGEAPENWTHVRVSWARSYFDCAPEFWGTTLEQLKLLGAPENVRIVFGFDS